MADNSNATGSPEEPKDGDGGTKDPSSTTAEQAVAIDGALQPVPSSLMRYATDPDLRSSVHLDLSHRNVKLPLMSTVCEYLALLNTPLISLTLSRNAIGPSGALLLGKALVTNNTLQFLGLESCELIGSAYRPQYDGVKSLAKGFESVRSTLQSVNLANNGLQPEGCRILLGALSFHRTLTALDVSHNLLGVFNDKEGVLALSYLLRYAKQLRSLAIDDNPLSTALWKPLQASLRATTALTVLSARRCELPIEQLREISHLTDLQY